MKPCGNGTAQDLQDSCTRNHISRAITLPVATKIEHVRKINAQLPQNHSLFIPFGAIHPKDPQWEEELQLLQEKNIRGVKIHPEYQNFDIDDPLFDPFFDTLAHCNLVVLTHAGWDPGFSGTHASPERILARLKRTPRLILVAAHMGGLCQWDDVEKLLVGKSLYFDTAVIASFMDKSHFYRMVQKHGAENILFGSDWPWDSQEKTLEYISASGLSERDIELIVSQNAIELLRLHTDA